MRKVKTVSYQGVTGSGETVDLSYDVWDGAHLTDADDVIFNGAGAPSRESVPRGRGYIDLVPGDSDQFSPKDIPSATGPKGQAPTE